jgi:hypothetical protein
MAGASPAMSIVSISADSAHEEPEQDDDRNRNSEQPESNGTHWNTPGVHVTIYAGATPIQRQMFRASGKLT